MAATAFPPWMLWVLIAVGLLLAFLKMLPKLIEGAKKLEDAGNGSSGFGSGGILGGMGRQR